MFRSSSHTLVSFALRLQEPSQTEGGVRASISLAQSALSGPAVTARGQAWSSPNISSSSPMSLLCPSPPRLLPSVSITGDYLFPPPVNRFCSQVQRSVVANRGDGIQRKMVFAPASSCFFFCPHLAIFFTERIEKAKSNRCDNPFHICPTSFWVGHEKGANSVSKDESLFLRGFFSVVHFGRGQISIVS